MTDALQDLRAREGVEAERLAERAALLGQGALSASTLAAGKKAATAALRTGEGALAGPAYALARLRHDPAFAPLLERELRKAEQLARDLVNEAMRQGFVTDGKGRGDATAAESNGLRISVTLDASDEALLLAYPIHGHTAAEWARHLAVLLRHGADAALALPLTGTISLVAIPAALSDESRLHGQRLASLVREAYFTGTQAATNALGQALTGKG